MVRTRDSEGDAVHSALLEWYRQEVAAAGEGVPIAEPAADERRGFVNCYQRVPLLLDAVERIEGRKAMERLLRRAFALGPQLSTGSFETLATKELGGGGAMLIARCLRARDWPGECGGRPGPS